MEIKPIVGEVKAQPINDNFSYVTQQIMNVSSGSPKGVFANLSELQAAYPNGASGIYIVQSDGKWYYWSGTAWLAGGNYQSSVVSVGKDDLQFNAVYPNATDFLAGTNITGIEKLNRTIKYNGSNQVYTFDTVSGEKCVLFAIDPKKVYAIKTTGSKLAIAQGYDTRDVNFYLNLTDAQNSFVGSLKTTNGKMSYVTGTLDNNPCLIVNTNSNATVTVTNISDIEIDGKYNLMLPKVDVDGVDFVAEGKNKFNKDSTGILLNTIITASGVVQSSSSSNLTHAIPVKKGDVVRFFNDTYMGSISSSLFRGGIFNNSNLVIAPLNKDYPGIVINSALGYGEITVQDPNAAYIKFNFHMSNKDSWMVAINDAYPKSYVPYAYLLDKTIGIYKSQLLENPIPNTSFERIYPDKVYVTCNDVKNDNYKFGKARQYSTALHLDHCVPDTIDDSAYIVGDKSPEKDKAYFYNPSFYDGNFLIVNNGNNIDVKPKEVEIKSDKYKIDKFTVNQVSTKASVSKDKNPMVLIIGDSQSQDVGMSPRYGNGENSYFGYLMKYFLLDKIDAGNVLNEYRIKTLGTRISESLKFNYAGVNVDTLANSEGYASFCLYDLIHHPDRIRADQASWDAKGLGNGTGTDYTGTPAQKDLFALTNYSSNVAEPVNRFYDNSKTGNTKFSLLKWIERYRTCDDNGNKLSLDSPSKGTFVNTQDFIDKYNICKPTHVVINLGRNDLASSSISAFMQNLQYMIDAIKSELPNVIIGICMTPDKAGTFFPNRYSKILDLDRMSARTEYEAVKQMKTTFGNMESNNVYLIPLYFIQPTAWGKALQEVSMPESLLGEPGYNQDSFRRYRVLVDGPETHPGSQAHLAWGYQVYSWMKYVLSK